jgi:hypothetical protein
MCDWSHLRLNSTCPFLAPTVAGDPAQPLSQANQSAFAGHHPSEKATRRQADRSYLPAVMSKRYLGPASSPSVEREHRYLTPAKLLAMTSIGL